MRGQTAARPKRAWRCCSSLAAAAPPKQLLLPPLALTGCLGAHDQRAHSVDEQVDKGEDDLGGKARHPRRLEHSGQVDVAAVHALRVVVGQGQDFRLKFRSASPRVHTQLSTHTRYQPTPPLILHRTRPAPPPTPTPPPPTATAHPHQEDVVVVVVLAELDRHRHYQRQVAHQRQPAVVARLLQRQEVRDLVLGAEEVQVEGARHDVRHDRERGPGPGAHQPGHEELRGHHGQHLRAAIARD